MEREAPNNAFVIIVFGVLGAVLQVNDQHFLLFILQALIIMMSPLSSIAELAPTFNVRYAILALVNTKY